MQDAMTEESGTLAATLAGELSAVDAELREIDLLIAQARAEAERHETKRAQSAEKLSTLTSRGEPAADLLELSSQLTTLTRRAAVMEAQVDVLEGKSKALVRLRDSVSRHAAALEGTEIAAPAGPGTGGRDQAAATASLTSGVSRMVLSAQEDMRREIARAMHDGPAQSLTNIVLQAQIVERIIDRDPARAKTEAGLLISMVQHTLEATKSFIFDVRPMVLDDLGLVPTLRRAARERGRRASVAVEFETYGQDRRLSIDLESGLFRMLDEALAGYLSAKPERVVLRLEWSDRLEARVTATRSEARAGVAARAEEGVRSDASALAEEGARAARAAGSRGGRGKQEGELPPALAAMMEDRRSDERAAVEAARLATIVELPARAWREISARATTMGLEAELLAEGGEVRIVAPVDEPEVDGADA